MTIILPRIHSGGRSGEGVAGIQDKVPVDVEIKAEADFDNVIVEGIGPALEFVVNVVGTNVTGEAIGEALLKAHASADGSSLGGVADVSIFESVATIPTDISLFSNTVGEAGLNVRVRGAATIITVANFSTGPETSCSAAAERVVNTPQEVLAGVVSKVVIVFGHTVTISQYRRRSLVQRIAEVLGKEVGDVVFASLGVIIIIDTGNGVTGYGGEALGPSVGYIQVVITIDVGLSAAGNGSTNLVIRLILVGEVETISDSQARADAVAQGKVETGALLEVIETFRGIHVVEWIVSNTKGIGGAAVTSAVFSDYRALDEHAVLLV